MQAYDAAVAGGALVLTGVLYLDHADLGRSRGIPKGIPGTEREIYRQLLAEERARFDAVGEAGRDTLRRVVDITIAEGRTNRWVDDARVAITSAPASGGGGGAERYSPAIGSIGCCFQPGSGSRNLISM